TDEDAIELVLDVARLLADDHDPGLGGAFAEDGVVAAAEQRAAATAISRRGHARDSRVRRHEIGRRAGWLSLESCGFRCLSRLHRAARGPRSAGGGHPTASRRMVTRVPRSPAFR